ncbi:MAG: hypothetical protein D3923_15135 [Candidatus Electrothrix sp. AR3]|nr:hypothetical protein [Candidatus Electrothrix sp. AR3]
MTFLSLSDELCNKNYKFCNNILKKGVEKYLYNYTKICKKTLCQIIIKSGGCFAVDRAIFTLVAMILVLRPKSSDMQSGNLKSMMTRLALNLFNAVKIRYIN